MSQFGREFLKPLVIRLMENIGLLGMGIVEGDSPGQYERR